MARKYPYFINRALQSVLVVFLLSVITFTLSLRSPIDPLAHLGATSEADNLNLGNRKEAERQQQLLRQELGLDRPPFYLKLAPSTLPYRYHELPQGPLRDLLRMHCYQGYLGRPLLEYLKLLNDSFLFSPIVAQNQQVQTLMLEEGFFSSIAHQLRVLPKIGELLGHEGLSNRVNRLTLLCQEALASKSSWRLAIPVVYFYPSNQYHHWLFGGQGRGRGAWVGDFGQSWSSGKSVFGSLRRSLPITFVLSALSLVVAIIGGGAFGVVLAYHHHRAWARVAGGGLFLVYTIPSFWLATLLLLCFANPDVLHWFPPGGLPFGVGRGLGDIMGAWPYLVLPVASLSYGGFCMVGRFMRASVSETLHEPYVFAARAKGIGEGRILVSHVLPNALLPLITIMGGILPALFSGSVITETIFSIPGMGYLLFGATLSNDIPTVMAILSISALLSALGYLLCDVVYALVDPRIRLSKL
ncbi:MAG: ABC transporter permease [Bacteroidetes bacterium]|nr:ABC transporter permease [Bacteroidota bacterium]